MILSRRWTVPSHIVLILGLILTLGPFVYTFINSIKYFKDIATGTLIFKFALNLTSTHTATIPVGISKFAQQYEIRYGEMAAAAFFATIPAILFIAFAQRQIVRGLTLGALK